MFELSLLAKLALALFLGALLGWTRERTGKAAGLRTYALVSGGSALFTLISISVFAPGDSPHIASQIVSGIGFIGAGTILRHGDHVEGVTTAAGLWITAAVGMAVGTGLYALSTGSTILIALVLFLDDKKLLAKKPIKPSKKEPSRDLSF